jgi:Leucine-rich repeat (LRR) protein
MLTSLEILDLSNNQLTDLPIELNSLTALLNLDLDHNLFTDVPAVTATLTNLQVLYLGRNTLSALPIQLSGLNHLNELALHNNEFRQVPPVIERLTHLSTLNISVNQIAEIPAFLTNPTQNLTVCVFDNPIRSIRGVFGHNIAGINMDMIEEMDVTFYEWFESHCILPLVSIFLLAHEINPFILCINAIMRNVVLPIVVFFRDLMGYPYIFRVRL